MKQTENKIAEIIASQIGKSALFMMGTKTMMKTKTGGLLIRFTASRKVNYIKIELNAMDLYNIEFYKIRGTNIKTISSFEDVYCDMLKIVIEKETGLYLSL